VKIVGQRFFLLLLLLIAAQTFVLLYPKTHRVPQDFPTIKSAVRACSDGDVIEVEDGFYFEKNIVLDKNIKLRAKNIFGAIINGPSPESPTEAIFLVRAEVDISGFILKNGVHGILQRESPDVGWRAYDLAILNMKGAAISVNDAKENTGRATVYNVMVDNCRCAFITNDACGMEVRNCLVTNCSDAFAGFDHIYFHVDKIIVWNCARVFSEEKISPSPPATNKIARGQDIIILDSLLSSEKKNGKSDVFLADLSVESKTGAGRKAKPQSIREGLALTIAGDIYCRLKDCTPAIEFYKAALRIGHEAESEEVIWRAYSGLALALEEQGNLSAAVENYKRAVLVLEGMRGKLPLRFYNPGFFQDKMEIYVSLIRLLYLRYQDDPSREYAEEAFAFLVTKEAVSLAQLPGSQELLPLVNNYLKFLNLKKTKKFLAERGGRRLNDLLLGAFLSRLGTGIKKIIITPDGCLYYLPFEALMERKGNIQGNMPQQEEASQFLIEKYEFSYAPSASAFVRLIERRKSSKRAMDLLAVAAPKLPESTKLVSGLSSDFPTLKFALREVKAISRLFDDQKKKVLYGPQAEERQIKELNLKDYRIIHFAAHGPFDDENWSRSGLLLSRKQNSTEDGFFQPQDIYLLNLSSDLVVLSACQTGKGMLETGEGLIGLAGAFRFAASDSVLVSLWNINDKSTAQFMGYFYSYRFSSGLCG